MMRSQLRVLAVLTILLAGWAAVPMPVAARGSRPAPNVVPTLTALSPDTVAAGSPAFILTATGADFVPGSTVRWNGADRPTTFLSSTQLNGAISAADVAAGGPFAVTVYTPGSGTSTLLNLHLYTRAGQDATADVVLGQPDFITNTASNPLMPSGSQLSVPAAAAIDASTGRLLVADLGNNRVLGWPNAPAFANGQPADLVIGQPDFIQSTPNNGGLSARSLSGPNGVAVDAHGNLYVTDFNNSRVLEYNAPLSTWMPATAVFGQGGSFTSGVSNNGGVSANSLANPGGVAVDGSGNVYVGDTVNYRVLEYDTPLSTDTTADRVFGQPDFSQHANNNGGVSATSLSLIYGVAVDASGNLYVGDGVNNRVLEYAAPLTSAMGATRVFGQADFTHATPNNGGLGAASLNVPQRLAVDARGNLYVGDRGNQRVLVYAAPLSTGMAAGRVFGQPDFTHNAANNGNLVPSATSLSSPFGVAVDAHNNLYVADLDNNRLVEYDWALVRVALPLVRR